MIHRLLLILLLLHPFGARAADDIYGEDDTQPTAQTIVPRYDPAGEAVRSFVLPGWSQHRQGHPASGWAYTTIEIVTFVFAIGIFEVPLVGGEDDNFGQVLGGVLYGLNAVVSGFDAHGRAVESNREHGWDLDESTVRSDFGVRFSLVRVKF